MNTSLLPSHRPEIEKAIDSVIADFYANLPLQEIDINPASCRLDILEVLAYSYNLSLSGLDEQQQRRLVSKAFELNRYKGTAYAVKEALKALLPTAEIMEHPDEPYIFTVKVEFKLEDEVFNPIAHETLLRVLNQTKNARSVLKGIQVLTPDMKANFKKVSAVMLSI